MYAIRSYYECHDFLDTLHGRFRHRTTEIAEQFWLVKCGSHDGIENPEQTAGIKQQDHGNTVTEHESGVATDHYQRDKGHELDTPAAMIEQVPVLGIDVETEQPSNEGFLYAPEDRIQPIAGRSIEGQTDEGDVAGARITSYNVCYTKLLRGRR